jgi:hypothetical protein
LGLWFAGFVGIAAILVGTHDSSEQRGVMQGQLNTMQSAVGQSGETIATMKAQADIMRGQLNEMEIARRPWVTADIKIVGQLTMRDGGSVEIQTIIILRNPGQTPATETSIDGVGFLPIAPFTTAENALACQQADLPIQKGTSIGPNVFPGDRKVLDYTFSITKERIEAYWTQSPAMKPTLFPFIVICVAYLEHAHGKIHHTSFAFQILGVTKPIRATEMPIPISELSFRTFPFSTLPPD